MLTASWQLVLACLLLQSPTVMASPARQAGGVAARINDEVVTWEDVDQRLANSPRENITPELRRAELKQAVQERLFLQEARKLNLNVSEAEVDTRIEIIKKQVGRPEDSREVIEKKFEERLAFLHRTLAEFREQLRIEMVTQRLYGRLVSESMSRPGVKSTLLIDLVSPEEVRAYYQAHAEKFKPIFHITVGRIALRFANAGEKADKLRRAESLRRALEAGAEFQAIARYYAEITAGNMTFVYHELRPEASEFMEETNKIIFHELKEGAVSDPVFDRNTVNLFKLERRVNIKGESFEEVQGRIRAELENKKREDNRILLRNELLKSAYLEPATLFEN